MTAPSSGTSVDHQEAPRPGRPAWLVPAGLAVAIAGLVAGLVLGNGMTTAEVTRIDDAVSVGFARDMITHHAQAVAMSEIAHRRSADPALNYLAFDILSTQQGQIGIMSGWLDLWDQSQRGRGPQMAWMGHTGPMPGMASREEIAELGTLPVAAMEEQWLRLMIRHHRGAIPMADAAAAQAESPDIALLARKMSDGQQSEIDAMQDMLRARGRAPEPDDQPGDHGADHGAPSATPHDDH